MKYVKKFFIVLAGAITAHYLCRYLDKIFSESTDV